MSFTSNLSDLMDKNFTQDHKTFISSGGRCPKCQTKDNFYQSNLFTGYTKNGEITNELSKNKLFVQNIMNVLNPLSSIITLIEKITTSKAVYIKCNTCKFSWITLKKYENLLLMNLEFIEEGKEKRLLVNEEKIFDNSESDSQTKYTYRISKEESKTYSIDYEISKNNSTEASFTLDKVGSLKSIIQTNFKTKYSITENSKITKEETIDVQVSPRTNITIIIQWRQVVQQGYIKVKDFANKELKFPFELLIDLEYEFKQIDKK